MGVKNMMQQLARSSDLTDAPLPGIAIAEIADDKRVLIENHMGVIHYSGETICVRTKFGQIWVEGCNLELAKMSKQQLVITGTITCVKLMRG